MLGKIVQGLLWYKSQRSLRRRRKEKKNLLQGNYLKNKLEISPTKALDELTELRRHHSIHTDLIQNEKTICLSIIIPAYNAQETICCCLDSIIDQNIQSDYEVICVNDGSKDQTGQLIDEYCKKDPHFIAIHQKNQGLSGARNSGLAIAKGEYLLFVDSDDFLPKNCIDKMLENAKRSQADIVLGTVGKYITKYHILSHKRVKKDRCNKNLLDACDFTAGTAWGKIYQSKLWDRVRFFEGYAFEDTIIFLVIYPQCKKIYLSGKPIYYFRSSNNSLFKKQNNSMQGIDSLWVVIDSVRLAKELGVDIYKDEYYQLVLWHLSAIMRARMLSIDSQNILHNAFVVAADFVRTEFMSKKKYSFTGIHADVYELLERSFIEMDYGLWEQCSKSL